MNNVSLIGRLARDPEQKTNAPCLCRVKGGIVFPHLDEGGIFWTEEVPTPIEAEAEATLSSAVIVFALTDETPTIIEAEADNE